MAATFADTLTAPGGTGLEGLLVRVIPLEPSTVDVRQVYGVSDSDGDFSVSIPSGIACRFVVTSHGINHVLTPGDGETVTLAAALAGTPYSPENPTWL